jgi:hypothetical protein
VRLVPWKALENAGNADSPFHRALSGYPIKTLESERSRGSHAQWTRVGSINIGAKESHHAQAAGRQDALVDWMDAGGAFGRDRLPIDFRAQVAVARPQRRHAAGRGECKSWRGQ